jgi:hypothetical protein
VTWFAWDEGTETCVGPCDEDPCEEKENAVAGSCEVVGEEVFTCECDPGFGWDPDTDSCTANACEQDPCGIPTNSIRGTCTPVGEEGFECECRPGLSWDGVSERCTSCENFRECLLDCNPFFNLLDCANSCSDEFDEDCECDFDTQNPDYGRCQDQCSVTLHQVERWQCEVDCLFGPCLVIE